MSMKEGKEGVLKCSRTTTFPHRGPVNRTPPQPLSAPHQHHPSSTTAR